MGRGAGGSGARGYVDGYGWFVLYSRNQHDIVEQFSSNYKIKT